MTESTDQGTGQLPEQIEIVALAFKERGVRCHFLDTKQPVTFKPREMPWVEVPGEILTVKPGKLWSYAGTTYLSGEILSSQIDIGRLRLRPLKLRDEGIWKPAEQCWVEAEDPTRKYFESMIQAGERPEYTMEEITPGDDPEDPWEDPLSQAVEFYGCGDDISAHKIMERILTQDLRCLDAHAHLGAWSFESEGSAVTVKDALESAKRHYEVGFRIGELSFDSDFNGVLKWGFLENRPYLRCLHGYGLCHWRLGNVTEARAIFERMLWLNPTDNQGARYLLQAIDQGQSWEQMKAADEQERAKSRQALRQPAS